MFWRTVVRDSDENTRTSSQNQWARILDMASDTTRVLATGASWSGHERNHLFFGGLPGGHFERLSGVSGLDDPGDSRAFATLDYDRDGWLDVVLGNLSAPRTRLLRNEIGLRASAADNRFLAVRFVGGNTTPSPSREWSPRDGFGARVTIDLGGAGEITREHRIDDGFKAQNSATMFIGVGSADQVGAVEVRWPSGRTQRAIDVPSGTLLTIYEDASASPTGEAFVRASYRDLAIDHSVATSDWRSGLLPSEPSPNRVTLGGGGDAKLVMYLGVATWCTACATEIPELRALREAMSPNELAMIGVPFDPKEPREKLSRWAERFKPPYELSQLTSAQRDEFRKVVKAELWQTERLPLSIVTDASGQVLLARWGIPTLSQLRGLRWRMAEE